MKESLKLVLIPTLICLVAGALLAGVDSLTRERIAGVKRTKKLTALQQVLPPYDNHPDSNACTINHEGHDWTFYVARKAGAFAGTAVETSSPAGYGGDISLMLGINADNQTEAISILGQKETPGLGAKIKGNVFKSYFAKKSIAETQWAVKKDAGDIDQISSATISSRAVVEAVKAAIDIYQANIDTIQNTGQ
jgi:electron transport complex protein RnfG